MWVILSIQLMACAVSPICNNSEVYKTKKHEVEYCQWEMISWFVSFKHLTGRLE